VSAPARDLEITRLLARAERLLRDGATRAAPELADDAALRREAARLAPRLEELVGRRYGRLPRIGYRRGLEARLAGPWSQYLTLGLGPTRIVRIASGPGARPVIPTILAHELAHRFAFDESVTTLRGIELSARLAEEGDALHARSVRLELGRLALGAALAATCRGAAPRPVEAFLERMTGAPGTERLAAGWEGMRRAAAAGQGPGCTLLLYAERPAGALEAARACGARHAAPMPLPRIPVRGAQSLFLALTARADAWTGRRDVSVPLDATLRLWEAADG